MAATNRVKQTEIGKIPVEWGMEENQKEVFVHELLHLRYPNHGRMFKEALVRYLRKLN